LTGLAYFHARAGRREEADAALRELLTKHTTHSAYQIAQIYSVRGEVDSAFEWLERGFMQRDTGVTLVKIDPLFRGLYEDPRWGAFLRKMNLE
jgi:hypothetical protein